MQQLRLHESTVVLGLVAATLLALICIPGRVYNRFPGAFTSYEHGWPFVYLRRETVELPVFAGVRFASLRNSLQTLPMGGVPWLSADNWKFWQFHSYPEHPLWVLNLKALAADGVALIAILLAILICAEYRRRRRPSVLSVSLADIFLVFILVCGVLGWVVHIRDGYQKELELEATFDGQNGPSVGQVKCVAPEWVSALVGNCWMPAFMWRVDGVTCPQEVDSITTLRNSMDTFAYLRSVSLYGTVIGDGHYPFARLRSTRRLDTLSISNAPRIDERDVQELVQLVGLKKIIISKSEVNPKLIQKLESGLPGCEIMDCMDAWDSEDGW